MMCNRELGATFTSPMNSDSSLTPECPVSIVCPVRTACGVAPFEDIFQMERSLRSGAAIRHTPDTMTATIVVAAAMPTHHVKYEWRPTRIPLAARCDISGDGLYRNCS